MTTATKLRIRLERIARLHVEACECDYEAAQQRLDTARKVYEYIKSGKLMVECLFPLRNETWGRAERYSARLDALIEVVSDVEEEGP